MEKSFPFNAVAIDGVPDRVYTAEDFAAERAAYVSNGVTSADSLTVTPSSLGGMAVEVAAGTAVIDGYTYRNTAVLSLSLTEADAALPRIDRVVLRLDLTAREMRCAILTGTASEMPTAPICTYTDTVREIPLAAVFIPAGETFIEGTYLTDLRPRADYILNRLEVEEMLARYETALSDYFDGTDAAQLVKAANVFRTDAGSDALLCGDGQYRFFLDAFPGMKELCRITESGTFDPSAYPTADGLYTVVLIGAGGSGAAGGGTGGSAGGMAVLAHLPLPQKPVSVTIGAGGISRKKYLTLNMAGEDGGATSFGGFTVPGGEGGLESVSYEATPAVVGIFTAEVGTAEKGADSYFGEGGVGGKKKSGTVPGTDGVAGGIGAGGGRAVETDTYSGAGGSGAVIIYGVPAGSLEEIS